MARTLTMPMRGTGTRDTPSTAELDRMAIWLDSKFSVLGLRFGVDSLLGILPVGGGLAGAALSSYIIAQAWRLGARKRTLARMAANVLGDTVVGSIPLLGTVVDVFWKANTSNMRILRRELARPDVRRRI
jgi:hypothetical protein